MTAPVANLPDLLIIPKEVLNHLLKDLQRLNEIEHAAKNILSVMDDLTTPEKDGSNNLMRIEIAQGLPHAIFKQAIMELSHALSSKP